MKFPIKDLTVIRPGKIDYICVSSFFPISSNRWICYCA